MPSLQSEICDRLSSMHDNPTPAHATQQEELLIQDIKAARAEIAELEQKRRTLFRLQEEAAARQCDIDSANEFFKLERTWRREPAIGRDLLGSNWHGAKLLARIWATILRVLNKPDSPVALDEARELLLAEGFSERIQLQTPESWWIMARCLAMHPEPEIAIRDWIRRSRASDKAVETRRAMNAYAEAPGADQSRCDLLEMALERESFWSDRANALKNEHQTRRELYRAGLQANRQMTSSIRTLNGFIKYERARLAKLQKDLQKAGESRARLEERARQNTEKAAARQGGRKSIRAQMKEVCPDEKQIEIGTYRKEPVLNDQGDQSSAISDTQQALDFQLKSSPGDRQEKTSPFQVATKSARDPSPESCSIDPTIQTMLAGWTDEELTHEPNHEKFMELFLRLPRPDWLLMKRLMKLEKDRREKDGSYLRTG